MDGERPENSAAQRRRISRQRGGFLSRARSSPGPLLQIVVARSDSRQPKIVLSVIVPLAQNAALQRIRKIGGNRAMPGCVKDRFVRQDPC
jgi:hypothetical protein